MLKLTNKVTFSEKVQIACLPKANTNTYPDINKSVYAVGWGVTQWGKFHNLLMLKKIDFILSLYIFADIKYICVCKGGRLSNMLNNVKLSIYSASYCENVTELAGFSKNFDSQMCVGELSGGK